MSQRLRHPKCKTLEITSNKFNENLIEIYKVYEAYPLMVQINNIGTQSLQVQMNKDPEAIFDLGSSETQIFNNGDLDIGSIGFACDSIGKVQVIFGVLKID